MRPPENQVVGNRLALVGAIVYLLEWVVIIPVGASGVASPGTTPADVVASYAENAGGLALWASWFSLVLLGRIAFAAGVRGAPRQSPRQLPLADLALGVMVVSVILEIAAYAVVGSAGRLADQGAADQATIVALDTVASWLIVVIWAPLGLFIAASSLAMLWSGLFPTWMCWLGLVAGVAGMADGVLAGPGFGPGMLNNLFQVFSVFVPLFWIWMLATAVFLFRHAVPRERGGTEAVTA